MLPDDGFENELTLQSHREADTVDAFHRAYESAVERVRDRLGGTHPLRIGGEAVETDERFAVTSPGDRDCRIGTFGAAG
jgi:1-pyrroline-5-carboxylate dehydrogenase